MKKRVFVIGSPRSGTSILGEALRRGAGYAGCNEGQVFELFPQLASVVDKHYERSAGVLRNPAHMISLVPRETFIDVLSQLFARIEAEHFGDRPWMDKTPGGNMIAGAPWLARLWPDAVFIYATRRGLENVASRRRKFPNVGFDRHCLMWADCAQKWLAVRDDAQLAGRWLQVDQQDVAQSPERVAAQLAAFLQLDASGQQALLTVFTGSHPERTASSAGPMTLAGSGWSETEQAVFMKHCGPMMEAMGYSLDQAYYR